MVEKLQAPGDGVAHATVPLVRVYLRMLSQVYSPQLNVECEEVAAPPYLLKWDGEIVGLDPRLLQGDDGRSSLLRCARNGEEIAPNAQHNHNQQPYLLPNPGLIDGIATDVCCSDPFQLVVPPVTSDVLYTVVLTGDSDS